MVTESQQQPPHQTQPQPEQKDTQKQQLLQQQQIEISKVRKGQLNLGKIKIQNSKFKDFNSYDLRTGSVIINPVQAQTKTSEFCLCPYPWMFGDTSQIIHDDNISTVTLTLGFHFESARFMVHSTRPIKINNAIVTCSSNFVFLPIDSTCVFEGQEDSWKIDFEPRKFNGNLSAIQEIRQALFLSFTTNSKFLPVFRPTPPAPPVSTSSSSSSNIVSLTSSSSSDNLTFPVNINSLAKEDRKKWLNSDVIDSLLIQILQQKGPCSLNEIHEKILTQYPFLESTSSRLKILLRARLASCALFQVSESPMSIRENFWRLSDNYRKTNNTVNIPHGVGHSKCFDSSPEISPKNSPLE